MKKFLSTISVLYSLSFNWLWNIECIACGTFFYFIANKTDLLSNDELINAKNISDRSEKIRTVSALTGDGLSVLLSEIDENLKEITVSDVVKLALTEGGRRAWLYKNNLVKNEVSNENFIELSVTWTPKQAAQFLKV